MAHWILAINPGSTSTKLGLFKDDSLAEEKALRHNPADLAPKVPDQLKYRTQLVAAWLQRVFNGALAAVVGRGGLLKPVASGAYRVNEAMRADLRLGVGGQHAANLGALIAWEIASPLSIPAYIVDPVSVDEMIPEAKISGLPEITRHSFSHALNIKAIARRAAEELGRRLEAVNFVVVHLGGGISVAPLQGGKMIDVNDANEMGPFSPERSGGLPSGDLARLCFTGEYSQEELLYKLVRCGGLAAYLGANDGLEVEKRIANGDEQANFVYRTMAYQIAKEVGAMATVLKGNVHAILITGGLARSDLLCGWIKEFVDYIAPVRIYPGEDELLALAQGCLRVLKGEEPARDYV